MTKRLHYSEQKEQSRRFFREIKNDLGFPSTKKIIRQVRAVLLQVRRSLSHEQASVVVNNLPGLFQLLFIANWKSEDTDFPIKHLDELVDYVYEEDKKSAHSVFTSEIDTLNTVILVLNKLDKFSGILRLNVFRYSLTQELKQAAIEEAA